MDRRTEWALLPLRLVIGFGFAAHGYAKLARGPEGFATILLAMGIPQPDIMAWVTTLLELVGGIAVMAGAFVVPLAVPLVVVMLTAMVGVHLQYGFSSIRLQAVTPSGAQFGPVGYEINLLYVAALVALAWAGPGRLSVDRRFGTSRVPEPKPEAGGVSSGRGGRLASSAGDPPATRRSPN